MFYSREAVGSYDELGLRTSSKELASDYRELELVQSREVEPVLAVEPARELRREPERSKTDNYVHHDVPTRWLSLEATRRELETLRWVALSEYSRDERKAAFSVLNALEREAPHHQLRVPKDWHHSLRDPGALKLQIDETRERTVDQSRAQAAERARNIEQTRELKQERNRGRGMGRGR